MKKTLKEYFYVTIGSGLSRGLALLSSILIARTLGSEGFGMFTLFFVVMILTWQLPQAFDTTFVRYAKAHDKDDEKNNFLRVDVFLKILYALCALLLAYPISFSLSTYFFKKSDLTESLTIAIISGVFLSFLMTITSIFQEKEKFFKFAILNASYTAVIFFLLMLLKFSKYSFTFDRVIEIYAVVSILIGIISIYLIFKNKIKSLFPIDLRSLKTSYALGKWIFGVTCVFFLFERLDILFLTRYAKFETIGVYSAAIQLVMVVSVLAGSLSGVFLPKASKSLQSKTDFYHYVKQAFLAVTIIDTLLIIFIICAPFCTRIVFGKEYVGSGNVLRILLGGWFFAILYLPFSFLFYVLDDSRMRFLLEVFKIAIAIVLLNILVPKFGLTGAAISMSISLIVNALVSFWILYGKLHRMLFL